MSGGGQCSERRAEAVGAAAQNGAAAVSEKRCCAYYMLHNYDVSYKILLVSLLVDGRVRYKAMETARDQQQRVPVPMPMEVA